MTPSLCWSRAAALASPFFAELSLFLCTVDLFLRSAMVFSALFVTNFLKIQQINYQFKNSKLSHGVLGFWGFGVSVLVATLGV